MATIKLFLKDNSQVIRHLGKIILAYLGLFAFLELLIFFAQEYVM